MAPISQPAQRHRGLRNWPVGKRKRIRKTGKMKDIHCTPSRSRRRRSGTVRLSGAVSGTSADMTIPMTTALPMNDKIHPITLPCALVVTMAPRAANTGDKRTSRTLNGSPSGRSAKTNAPNATAATTPVQIQGAHRRHRERASLAPVM
jgi:hypothetical protein